MGNRRFSLMAALLTMLIAGATTSQAFDNQRKGFVAGLSIGPAFSSLSQDGGSRQSELGLATILRLGGGLNEHSLIYFTANMNWLGMDTASGGTRTMVSSVMGIGYTYYLKGQAPTTFFNAGLGYSSWRAPFDSDVIRQSGFGGLVGVGYEIKSHLQIELNFMLGSTENSDGGFSASSDALGIQLTIGYVAF